MYVCILRHIKWHENYPGGVVLSTNATGPKRKGRDDISHQLRSAIISLLPCHLRQQAYAGLNQVLIDR